MPRRPAPRILLMLALAAVLIVAFAPGSTGAPGQPAKPDLVSDAPDEQLIEQYASGGQTRLLLRFNGYIHNQGNGAADLRAGGRVGREMTRVVQRLYSSPVSYTELASPAKVLFESEDGHNHWHLKHAARYSLWNGAKTAEVAPAMKAGFCLEDSERADAHAGPTRVYSDDAVSFCQQGQPNASSVYMGTSAGWRDVYHRGLAFQWVDVSDVQPGRYWLRSEVDPDNVIQESNEVNEASYAATESVISGHLAQPVGARVGREPATITLKALEFRNEFGTLGPRQFRIDRAPQQGTLNVPVGQWFAGSSVQYTPGPGATGGDSFEFSARDASSPFPRNPARASALIALPAPPAETIALSGGPGEVHTGASVQFTATTRNATREVAWSVNGVPGGNATVGTISASGLYRAPASVPGEDVVRIRAALPSAFDEVGLRVVPKPRATPAKIPPAPPGGPGPGGPSGPTPPSGPDGRPRARPAALPMPRIARDGRMLFVYVRPNRAGRVNVRALRGRKRMVACRTVRVPAKRRHTCRLRIPRRVALRQVSVLVELRVGKKVVGKRRMKLPLKRAAPRHAHGAHGGHHR